MKTIPKLYELEDGVVAEAYKMSEPEEQDNTISQFRDYIYKFDRWIETGCKCPFDEHDRNWLNCSFVDSLYLLDEGSKKGLEKICRIGNLSVFKFIYNRTIKFSSPQTNITQASILLRGESNRFRTDLFIISCANGHLEIAQILEPNIQHNVYKDPSTLVDVIELVYKLVVYKYPHVKKWLNETYYPLTSTNGWMRVDINDEIFKDILQL